MVLKINISEKSGKTYHLELDNQVFIDKKLHEKIEGKDISKDLEGYEFEITGATDNSGFTLMENIEGTVLKKVLLGYGKGMHKRVRREGKKKVSNFKPKGLRLRKTVRGNTISEEVSQINLKIIKEGNKSLKDIFPDQNLPKEKKEEKAEKQE